MTKLATFGLMCAAALLVSLFAKKDGHVLRVAAAVIASNWLLFAMPWIYAPAALSFAVGGSNLDAWAMTDLLSMVVIAWAGRGAWWSPAIWSLYLVTLSMFSIAYALGLPYDQYLYVLDGALIVQLSMIFVIGGGDVADFLSDRWRYSRLRILGWTTLALRKRSR